MLRNGLSAPATVRLRMSLLLPWYYDQVDKGNRAPWLGVLTRLKSIDTILYLKLFLYKTSAEGLLSTTAGR
jgi:hypothetical protein